MSNIVLRRIAPILNRNMATKGEIMTATIKKKLKDNLNPTHLEVYNESSMHNVPIGSGTHFKVLVISEKFKGLPLIKRHRLINDILKEEFQDTLHALSIIAKTPEQWNMSDQTIEPSPNCKGGFGK